MTEADAKRARGEKRPDPPQPTTGGRGRRYDGSAAVGPSRPLAVAPGIEMHGEPAQAKLEATGQPPRAQPFSGYGVPIAQAPTQQQPPPPPGQPGQQPIPIQQLGVPQPQPVSQAMSPSARPLRAPVQVFSFPEQQQQQQQRRDREAAAQSQQRVPLPQKSGAGQVPELRDQRPLAAAQSMQSPRPDPMLDRQHRERERERDRERELARQAERQSLRMNTEAEQRHYEQQQYGHRHQSSIGRSDPLALSRPVAPEASRSAAGQAYPLSMHQQQAPPHSARGPGEHASAAQSPPLGPSGRAMPSLQQRPPLGQTQDYGHAPPRSSTPASVSGRPSEPRKTSSIMSLLNDDPPPASKRLSEVSNAPSRPSATPPPPPQAMGRPPPPGQAPPAQMRRDTEPQYGSYGRSSVGASGMPSLKPTYGGSPNPSPLAAPPPAERDPYYRGHPAYQPGHQSGNSSPQSSHRYPPPAQQAQAQYQTQGGYAQGYPASQAPHAGSPPPPYSGHGAAPRARELGPGGRDAGWAQQPPGGAAAGGWPQQAGKPSSQGPPPPPQQSWAPHPSSTPKPSTPSQTWGPAPPPQHVGMRDERGGPVYGSTPQPPQHAMQSRYPPPGSRQPEPPGPPPPPSSSGYPRYASAAPGPGSGPRRDPREQTRSYTPGGYDARGPPPPPPPGGGYAVPDPRDMQMRDGRDPREVMGRGLRPHEYERHPDQYRR